MSHEASESLNKIPITQASRVLERELAQSNDQVRLEMVHQLHQAVYGDTWARPESPKEVWQMLLERVADEFVEERERRAVVDAEIRAQIVAAAVVDTGEAQKCE